MPKKNPIVQSLAIVDQAFREFFPADFHKRCMYAAFGLSALLEDVGIASHVIGGDFLCAVVSRDGSQLNLQGFRAINAGEASHFWVLTHDFLLDLGTAFLPQESSFKAQPMPIMCWHISTPLPNFICYRELLRISPRASLTDPEVNRRKDAFLTRCRSISYSRKKNCRPSTWLLKDYQSLHHAAQKGDRWALAAMEFLRLSMKADLPLV